MQYPWPFPYAPQHYAPQPQPHTAPTFYPIPQPATTIPPQFPQPTMPPQPTWPTTSPFQQPATQLSPPPPQPTFPVPHALPPQDPMLHSTPPATPLPPSTPAPQSTPIRTPAPQPTATTARAPPPSPSPSIPSVAALRTSRRNRLLHQSAQPVQTLPTPPMQWTHYPGHLSRRHHHLHAQRKSATDTGDTAVADAAPAEGVLPPDIAPTDITTQHADDDLLLLPTTPPPATHHPHASLLPNTDYQQQDSASRQSTPTYPTHPPVRRVLNKWQAPPHFHQKTKQEQIEIWMDYHAAQFDTPNKPHHSYIARALLDSGLTYNDICDYRQFTHIKWNDATNQYDLFHFNHITIPTLAHKAPAVFHLQQHVPHPQRLGLSTSKVGTQAPLATLSTSSSRAVFCPALPTSPTIRASLHKVLGKHNNCNTTTNIKPAYSTTPGTSQRTHTPSSCPSQLGARVQSLPKEVRNKL